MASTPTHSGPPIAPNSGHERELAKRREQYIYREAADNQLAPIAMAKSWPWLREQYAPSWLIHFVPTYLGSHVSWFVSSLRAGFQRLFFRFDKMRAYRQLFREGLPRFAELADSDQAFAYRRVAGANAVSLTQTRELKSLCARIPLDVGRIERRMAKALGRAFSLDEEAAAGRLFVDDFRLLQSALPFDRTRDSRWRPKYMATSIGVFLEAPGYYEDSDLVALAVQVDQPQHNDERNPVYYPDDGWGWKIAKAFFESASVSFHSGAGHIYRTHLLLEPFCMATPRQLPEDHPIYLLLRPHTRFTLAANEAAYKYFTHRANTYYEFYSGTLEETRNISIQDSLAHDFRQLQLRTELASRGVDQSPSEYPYRDDSLLWLEPIEAFAAEYVDAFYPDDESIRSDRYLQNWLAEITDPKLGNLRNVVPGDFLDTKQKLKELLAQVLFTGGPGHASQHFASNFYYRFSPATPGASYRPPPLNKNQESKAFFVDMLPTIRAARDQFMYNTFTNYKYDRFGHYERYPLNDLPAAQEPIRKLRNALEEIEHKIRKRNPDRFLPYGFLRPSVVPNSTNI